MQKSILSFLAFVGLSVCIACQPQEQPQALIVSLVADGRKLSFQYNVAVTVEEFLRDANIERNESDRISHPLYTQITDGMTVTIVRVEEQTECRQEEIPYERNIVPNEGLQSGEERLAQPGKNGLQEVCYRIVFEDGIEKSRVRAGQPTIINEPEDEVVFVGNDNEIEPIPVPGTLAYINNGNAWVIKGNSTSKRNITTIADLDSHVFALSPDGQFLMFTGKNTQDETFFNQLWLIETTSTREAIPLVPTDVIHASWIPNRTNTVSYSTGESQTLPPYWKAFNNLWIIRVDPQSGQTLDIDPLIPDSLGGLYGWWGTVYEWSPNGEQLAWIRADSIGLVNLENGELLPPLISYPVFNTSQDWSWRSTASWSWDLNLLATVVHGPPIGTEPPENSPVFNLTIADAGGNFTALVVDSVGMWSSPQFSPLTNTTNERFPQGFIAYLRSRRPHNSVNGEYDLVVADRDGSNTRVIFPDFALPGITTTDFGISPRNYSWSPDGKQIALIYQGNLWIVDVNSTVAHQLTFDGQSSNPVWSR